jgi:hypothetical protein
MTQSRLVLIHNNINQKPTLGPQAGVDELFEGFWGQFTAHSRAPAARPSH